MCPPGNSILYSMKKTIKINFLLGLLGTISYLAVYRGDWGTLRRNNSNSQTILIFEIKHFDDTYGYGIQWGYIVQEMIFI